MGLCVSDAERELDVGIVLLQENFDQDHGCNSYILLPHNKETHESESTSLVSWKTIFYEHQPILAQPQNY